MSDSNEHIIDSFNNLSIDPIPRSMSAMSAYRSTPSQHPTHAMSLPPTLPHHPTAYDDYPPPPQYTSDGYLPPRPYDDYDVDQSYHSYDDPSMSSQPYLPWQPQPPPATGGYNPLYAAASDVLGMAPPPPLPPPPPPNSLARSIGSQSSPSSTMPSDRSRYAPSVSSGHSNNSGQFQQPVDSDFEPRPPHSRAATSASVTLSSTKSKAVDLSAPPYTKEYIEQYRHRIKADPDPEAHFLYAKYLIDAAKYIRTAHKDQRAAKKYSEVLVGESIKVVRRLATQGDAYDEAQFFLANCYGTGALGLQVDHERAYHLYLQAAKQNHAAASYRVAVCNEIGAGTKKELPRAAAFYRKAASLGDTPAMFKLGMIQLHGSLGEQKNPREAISWLKRAAEQADEDNPHALHELALLYEQQSGALVPHDPIYAKNLLIQAAQLGYIPSQYKMGQCYEHGSLNFPVDPRRSIAWYTKAAEKGDSEAELALSGWYLTGSEGVLKQSDSEAYLWARRAANKGLSKAEYAVGYYAEVGIGIKQDIEFARRWYMRAAGTCLSNFLLLRYLWLTQALAQGNERAKAQLTRMKTKGIKKPNIITRDQAADCVIS